MFCNALLNQVCCFIQIFLDCYYQRSVLDPEDKCCIEAAHAILSKMRAYFCNDNINIKLHQRMVSYVFLYGMEVWPLKITTMRRLEVFEIWIYRRMLCISQVGRISNSQVLQRAHMQHKFLNTIKMKTNHLSWSHLEGGEILLATMNPKALLQRLS